ncbi:hypothetical protein LXL04_031882 [Taraxacum kok-saghyz]
MELEQEPKSSETMKELKQLLKLAGPLCLVSFLDYSLQIISVMFIGHLGELSLSVASMASSFAAVTGSHFLFGTGSALETFCGQAYGAQQYHITRVSNELGAGRPQGAQRASHVVMVVAMTEGLVVSFVLVVVRNIWGYLFTYEEESMAGAVSKPQFIE